MTKKQIAALQRILEREAAAYRALSGRPTPGQHPSQDKYAISDGNICVLLDAPIPEFPVGGQVNSLARIVYNERKGETHFPVPEGEIDRPRWAKQVRRCNNQIQGMALSAPIIRPDQLNFEETGIAETATEVTGKFDPQLLVDATDAVGGGPLYFLGYGPFNKHFPSLLVMPPRWTESNYAKPIALVLPLRV